jgi:hypothetical protein
MGLAFCVPRGLTGPFIQQQFPQLSQDLCVPCSTLTQKPPYPVFVWDLPGDGHQIHVLHKVHQGGLGFFLAHGTHHQKPELTQM